MIWVTACILVFYCGSLDSYANIGILVWVLVIKCKSWDPHVHRGSWDYSVDPEIPVWIVIFQ